MQGALERSHDNQYHLYNVDGYANHITEGAKVASPLLSHCQQQLRKRIAASDCIAKVAAAYRGCTVQRRRLDRRPGRALQLRETSACKISSKE